MGEQGTGEMNAPSRRVEMLPARRRAMILEWVRRDGAASVQELARHIKASQSTIRRDLEQLTEEGYLERTHGGALLVPPLQATFEREQSINALFQHDQKVAIGREAASRMHARESVLLDSSSTVLEAVRAATAQNESMTMVTNSLDIAQICVACPSWRVIMPGGMIRPGATQMVGEPAESFLRSIHADVCLVSAYAVSGRLLTEPSLEVSSLKRIMMQAARRKILLVDSAKFQPPAFSTFAEISDVDEVITDDGIGQSELDSLRAQNVRVTVVPVQPARDGEGG